MAIDWHLDVRSGYRWQEGMWFGDLRIGYPPATDVKGPWERARLQHLPRLAVAWAAGMEDRLCEEFQDQVLDFLAANPPRFGVNWGCPMDVAIRLSNILLAWDLFRASGASFRHRFEAELAAASRAHAMHVEREMEHEFRGNHFIADAAALIFAGAYLSGPDADRWLSRGREEILRETAHQFQNDGGNFEASTCYHRLSAEIVLWATAVGESAARKGRMAPFPDEHYERLGRIVDFTAGVMKPSGLVPQIGDNDSGRFIRLTTGEEDLDHRGLLALGGALLGRDFLPSRVDAALALVLAGGSRRRIPETRPASSFGDPLLLRHGKARLLDGLEVFKLQIPVQDLGTVESRAYPDFGLYVFSNARLYLAVRCGGIGQGGRGGHAHNDSLAVELWIDGQDWFADPGTYTYTSDPSMRNRYRSVRAHFAPQPAAEVEPSRLTRNLFLLKGDPKARCLAFGESGFVGVHKGYGSGVTRIVDIGRDKITIVDAARPGLLRPMLDGPPGPSTANPAALPFSPGYGRVAGSALPKKS